MEMPSAKHRRNLLQKQNSENELIDNLRGSSALETADEGTIGLVVACFSFGLSFLL